MPHITSAYLINGSCIDQLQDVYVGEIELSYEMNFAKNLRNKVWMKFSDRVYLLTEQPHHVYILRLKWDE